MTRKRLSFTPRPLYVGHYIAAQIERISDRKTQRQIADEAEFESRNFLAMIKSCDAKLPLERVGPLAAALECDPDELMRLALADLWQPRVIASISKALGTGEPLTENERGWIDHIRSSAGGRDPECKGVIRKMIFTLLQPHPE